MYTRGQLYDRQTRASESATLEARATIRSNFVRQNCGALWWRIDAHPELRTGRRSNETKRRGSNNATAKRGDSVVKQPAVPVVSLQRSVCFCSRARFDDGLLYMHDERYVHLRRIQFLRELGATYDNTRYSDIDTVNLHFKANLISVLEPYFNRTRYKYVIMLRKTNISE